MTVELEVNDARQLTPFEDVKSSVPLKVIIQNPCLTAQLDQIDEFKDQAGNTLIITICDHETIGIEVSPTEDIGDFEFADPELDID